MPFKTRESLEFSLLTNPVTLWHGFDFDNIKGRRLEDISKDIEKVISNENKLWMPVLLRQACLISSTSLAMLTVHIVSEYALDLTVSNKANRILLQIPHKNLLFSIHSLATIVISLLCFIENINKLQRLHKNCFKITGYKELSSWFHKTPHAKDQAKFNSEFKEYEGRFIPKKEYQDIFIQKNKDIPEWLKIHQLNIKKIQTRFFNQSKEIINIISLFSS